ncbi:b-cell lymphoma 3 [Caerostris extrusa]|uniref:B-cell lymphoma 3 n=1 Tax=Caerostris extrusa TaxID=172846 RepID=A0AAV4TKZ6_CAEEX|nr:b-cell lymphoma 3 [Caerostris extrusa]
MCSHVKSFYINGPYQLPSTNSTAFGGDDWQHRFGETAAEMWFLCHSERQKRQLGDPLGGEIGRQSRKVLNILLSHRDARDILNSLDHEGYSALHYAVFKNNKIAVRCLQKVGAQMDVIDGKSGRTPLIHAILNRNEELVTLLLECGACPDMSDYSGRTAFELALHASTKSIVQLLENRLFANDPVCNSISEGAKAPKRTTAGRAKRSSKSKKEETIRTNCN